MTEKEWLERTKAQKNIWIANNIFPNDALDYYMNWQGFGMIVEKVGNYTLNHIGASYEFTTYRCSMDIIIWAPTPWEAAALAYGKMRGLIK